AHRNLDGLNRLGNYDRYSRSSSPLSIRRHALSRQLFHRLIVLRQALQPHTAQHMRSLSELDVVIANDLDAAAPRIEEIEEGSRQCLDPGLRERCADRLLVVDHKAEVATIVTGLSAPLLQREELISQVNESRGVAPAA